MSRNMKLTWQPGRDGRAGRWRKKYLGKVYYFPGGRGKSDREASDRATKQWEFEKLRIDSAAPRKHQREYEAEIERWEQVLTWSQRHSDQSMAQLAFEKRERLRSMLEAPQLKPLPKEDCFQSLFALPTVEFPGNWQDVLKQPLTKDDFTNSVPIVSTREQREAVMKELDGSALRIQKEIWQDRLESQKRRAVHHSDSVEDYIQQFLAQKDSEASRGELSVGRCYALRLHLIHFQDWIGKDSAISDIDSQLLRTYQSALLELVQQSESQTKVSKRKDKKQSWTATTARHYLTTVKSFVRWLWEIEAISSLPRVLGSNSKSLRITPEPAVAVAFEHREVLSILQVANERMKLYVLLMLNCGMTQKDVADLRKSEVDLDSGRIIRKRSKTEKHESVPKVNYLLWPETLRLLRENMDQGNDERALLNKNGTPLWEERVGANGKYSKSDNIKNAFDRLRKEIGITKPLKCLKKTSSSKLRDNERFNGIEDLFLGHAPQKMSDKHYTTAPQKLLDSAIRWLASEYGLASPG